MIVSKVRLGPIEVALFAALLVLLCLVPASLAQNTPSNLPTNATVAEDSLCQARASKPKIGTWTCMFLPPYTDEYPAWVHLGDLDVSTDFNMPQSTIGFQIPFYVWGNVNIAGAVIVKDEMSTAMIVDGCFKASSINLEWKDFNIPDYSSQTTRESVVELTSYNVCTSNPNPFPGLKFVFEKPSRYCMLYQGELDTEAGCYRTSGVPCAEVKIKFRSRCATLPILIVFVLVLVAVLTIMVVFMCKQRATNSDQEEFQNM